MKPRDLLGLPLSAALEAAERGHLSISGWVHTRAQGEKRLLEEKTDLFEDRVIGCRGGTLILGRFRTAQPPEGTCAENGQASASPPPAGE